ncbi:MAG TPA: hypothetical protein VGZ25_16825 [Gemmataceae bacterium]|jgi:hypothetical protein|nr:hypothetical protein [Gemmataceae bacterium]
MRLAILWSVLPLIGILLVGALAIYIADLWRKRSRAISTESEEQLTDFRALFEDGELTQEEYDRIRQRLGQCMMRKHPENIPSPTPPDAPPSPPENPPSLN